jgi:quinolinate synthase
VHEQFSEKKTIQLKERYPDAKIIAHPECEENLLKLAHFVGSTSKLLQFTQEDSSHRYIVLTEPGILHQMRKASPNKDFIEGPAEGNCACNECPHMKKKYLRKNKGLHEKRIARISNARTTKNGCP